jgi:hypothetical protein
MNSQNAKEKIIVLLAAIIHQMELNTVLVVEFAGHLAMYER